MFFFSICRDTAQDNLFINLILLSKLVSSIINIENANLSPWVLTEQILHTYICDSHKWICLSSNILNQIQIWWKVMHNNNDNGIFINGKDLCWAKHQNTLSHKDKPYFIQFNHSWLHFNNNFLLKIKISMWIEQIITAYIFFTSIKNYCHIPNFIGIFVNMFFFDEMSFWYAILCV